jgi:YgiT-type zinc finger domain-containing protein
LFSDFLEASDVDMIITRCPACESKRIRRVRRTWSREFQGKPYKVENLEFYECPDCGERVYDREAMRKIEAHSPAFRKTRKLKRTA